MKAGTYYDPDDDSECPKQSRIDRMIDRADWERDQMKDRRLEEALEQTSKQIVADCAQAHRKALAYLIGQEAQP